MVCRWWRNWPHWALILLDLHFKTGSIGADGEPIGSESKSFYDEGKNQRILSSSSLKAKDVLEDIPRFLKSEAKPPFYVLGTVTKNEAIVQSWNGLGLNLFDLPRGMEKKIFHYIPILSFPDMLKAVIHKRYEYDNTYVQDAIDDIKWAKCHKWIRKIQKCFCHGKRDKMQFYGVDSAKDDIQKNIIEKYDDAQKQPSRQECHVNNALKNACTNISTEGEFQRLLRCIANLDCQSYRLAPPLGVRFDIIPQYKRVVILEDNKNMRNHIASLIEERYGTGIVQMASVEESQEKWSLCQKDGTEIKLSDDNCNEWETLVCFDLELGKNKEADGLPDGLRILYNTALAASFRISTCNYRLSNPGRKIIQRRNMWIFAQTVHQRRAKYCH